MIGILSHWSLYWITRRQLRKSTPKPCDHVKQVNLDLTPPQESTEIGRRISKVAKGWDIKSSICGDDRLRLLDHHLDLHLKNIKSETNIKNQSEWSMKKTAVNLSSLRRSLWLASDERINQSLCRERDSVWKDVSAVATGWWTPMDAGAWPRTGGWQVIMRIKKESSAWERWGASPGPMPCVLSKPGSTVNLTPWEKTKWDSDLKWGYITQQKRWGQICFFSTFSPDTRHNHTYLLPSSSLIRMTPKSSLGSYPVYPWNLLVHTGAISLSPWWTLTCHYFCNRSPATSSSGLLGIS